MRETAGSGVSLTIVREDGRREGSWIVNGGGEPGGKDKEMERGGRILKRKLFF